MFTLQDREEISRGLTEGMILGEIARNLGRDPSVVSREVVRHGGRKGIEPRQAMRPRSRLGGARS